MATTISNWPWQFKSFNCWAAGDYIMTGHKRGDGYYYIAYHAGRLIADDVATSAQAKQICMSHAKEAA
jgi:hypothetical protein